MNETKMFKVFQSCYSRWQRIQNMRTIKMERFGTIFNSVIRTSFMEQFQ